MIERFNAEAMDLWPGDTVTGPSGISMIVACVIWEMLVVRYDVDGIRKWDTIKVRKWNEGGWVIQHTAAKRFPDIKPAPIDDAPLPF